MKIWISDGDRHSNLESGYGQTSAAIGLSLREAGHDVRFESFAAMEACLYVCPPYSIRQRPEVPSAAYSLHELDTLPPGKQDWPDILNRLDLVITATDWNAEIWRNLGVTVPIAVVPDGVDTNIYQPPTGRTCTFLSVHSNLGSAGSREYWRDTLIAYLRAFTPAEQVRLVTKTWAWRAPQWESALNDVLLELGLEPGRSPAIEVIPERLSGEQMRDLYHGSWLFVKNADREGWSLPCTEALACGRPIAATRIEPLISILPDRTAWFEPHDIATLSAILRREYERFQAFRQSWERFPASAMGPRIVAAFEQLAAGELI